MIGPYLVAASPRPHPLLRPKVQGGQTDGLARAVPEGRIHGTVSPAMGLKWGLLLAGGLLGCDTGPERNPDAGDGSKPQLTTEQRQLLLSPSPEELPAPPSDPTNKWADDPTAAKFEQRLFFDGSLSGRLLDGDNDGSANALDDSQSQGHIVG
jgi:hypothetical protein